MLTAVHEGSEANDAGPEVGGSLLDEIVRDGARQMLASALRAELAAYVDDYPDQVDADGHRLVVRNAATNPARPRRRPGRCRSGRRGSTTSAPTR